MARADQAHLNYERAPDHLPDGDPVGHWEMRELTQRSRLVVYKWHERRHLPPADGPMVGGLPTWRRRTFLAWAYREGFTFESVPGFRRKRDQTPVPTLPIHAEAEEWAAKVPPESIVPLRDR